MYFKTVILLVNIRFISLPKVIKKMKSTTPPKKKSFFLGKSSYFENFTLYRKKVLRIAYIQTISKNKNENQTSRLGVESRFVKKKLFSPKTLKQCHMTKICSGKRCNRYHTTVVYNVLKSNFEYLHFRWKYSHLIRVLFKVSCTLKLSEVNLSCGDLFIMIKAIT